MKLILAAVPSVATRTAIGCVFAIPWEDVTYSSELRMRTRGHDIRADRSVHSYTMCFRFTLSCSCSTRILPIVPTEAAPGSALLAKYSQPALIPKHQQ